MVGPTSLLRVRLLPATVIMSLIASASAFGTCPQGPQVNVQSSLRHAVSLKLLKLGLGGQLFSVDCMVCPSLLPRQVLQSWFRTLLHSLLTSQTFGEATIFNVQCNDTDVVVWTAAEHVQLSSLAVFNKSLTVYGYMVQQCTFLAVAAAVRCAD